MWLNIMTKEYKSYRVALHKIFYRGLLFSPSAINNEVIVNRWDITVAKDDYVHLKWFIIPSGSISSVSQLDRDRLIMY